MHVPETRVCVCAMQATLAWLTAALASATVAVAFQLSKNIKRCQGQMCILIKFCSPARLVRPLSLCAISLVCLLPVSQATFDLKDALVVPASEYQVYAMQPRRPPGLPVINHLSCLLNVRLAAGQGAWP